ncbi:MAG: CHAT domain-containing protein [bacterium]|nr:CHAT domain-containing protein [bacterium]
MRGLLARNDGDVEHSVELLARGLRLATTHAETTLADEIAVTLSGSLAIAGRLDEAEEHLKEVAARQANVIGDKAQAQLGALYNFSARYADGARILEGLSARLETAGEPQWAARAASNRGWCLVQLGRSAEAIPELERGRDLWLELGAAESASQPAYHLAVALSLLGRPKEALTALQSARHDHDMQMDDYLDAADIYEQAGLVDDALMNAKAARDVSHTTREHGLCEIALARLFITTGRFGSAVEAAQAAVESFNEIDAADLAYAANVLLSDAQVRNGTADLVDTTALAPPKGQDGSRSAALAQILLGEVELAAGNFDAVSSVAESMSRGERHLGLQLTLRSHALLARLYAARGDTRGAIKRVLDEMRGVARHAAIAGSTDLAVGIRSTGSEIADFALGLAIDTDDIESMITLTDLMRAVDAAPRLDPDPAIAEKLAGYRLLKRRGADDAVIAAAEAELRGAVRIADATSTQVTKPVPLEEIRDGLKHDRLTVFIEAGDFLTRVDVSRGSVEATPVAPSATIDELAAKVRMRLVSALATLEPDHRHNALLGAAAQLDEYLFHNSAANESDVVLVPPPGVFGVPWSLLPNLKGHAIRVNASASAWAHADIADRVDADATVYVAGPAPDHAAFEVAELAAAHPGAQTLVGEAATAEAVLNLIDNDVRMHLAAHGISRTDNPILSSIGLADGPFTVYDMQTASPPAELIVSACSVGRPRTYRGGLSVGLPTAVLAGGTRTVVAAEVDVPDAPTRRAMLVLHEMLRNGHPPATALLKTTTALLTEDPGAALVAAAFNAYGA